MRIQPHSTNTTIRQSMFNKEHLPDTAFMFALLFTLSLIVTFSPPMRIGFVTVGLAGVCVTHFYWHRRLPDVCAVLCGTVLFLALSALRHSPEPLWCIPFAGMSSAIVLIARWAYSRGENRKLAGRIARVPGIVLLMANVAEIPQLITALYKNTLDPNLFAVDQLFGFQPSYRVASIVLRSRPFTTFLSAWYQGLAVGLIAVLVPIATSAKKTYPLLRDLVVSGGLGFLLYSVVPAVGPIHAYGGFPWSLPGTPASAIPGARVRNCFPSLHMTWALLMLLRSDRAWTRALSIAFVIFTALATLGLGEHYAVDLIVAVPFTALVFLSRGGRLLPCLSASALVVLWTAFALRPTLASETFSAAVLVTLVASVWLLAKGDAIDLSADRPASLPSDSLA